MERVLSELALADMASKAKLLESLSSFLSDVARTMTFSEEYHTLSAWIGESAVFLGQKEISQLHELVVQELKDQTRFLSELSCTGNQQMDEAADSNFSSLNLEIVSQTLRCCIRILSLVDFFDKNASLSSTRLLDGILEQLCQPAKLFHLLGIKALEGIHCGRFCRTAEGDERRECIESKQLHEACNASSRHGKEVILAILEVYMDELLLRPSLIARLISSREGVSLSVVQEQMTGYVRHTEASMEAAFVFVLFSLRSVGCTKALPGLRRNGCNLSLPAGLLLLEKFSSENVTPVLIEHIVRLLTRMLNATTPPDICALEELAKTRQNIVTNCRRGRVDWSYSSPERLPSWDLRDEILRTNVLQSQSTLNLASSILECTIRLYTRYCLASDTCSDGNNDTYRDDPGAPTSGLKAKSKKKEDVDSDRYHKAEGSLLHYYLSKYSPLFDVLGTSCKAKTTQVISESAAIGIGDLNLCRGDRHSFDDVLNSGNDLVDTSSVAIRVARAFIHDRMDAGSIYIKRRRKVVFEEEDALQNFGLIAALLQLMSCALNCIGREVCMLTWFSVAFDDEFLKAQAIPLSDFITSDCDKILHCVGIYLSLCLPSDQALCSISKEQRDGRAGEEELDSLNILVGRSIVFFTDILRCEVHKGAPDEVLERYLHLIESLLALLHALDDKNDSRKSAPGYGCECTTFLELFGSGKCRRCSPCEPERQLPTANNTSSYLQEMVLSLTGVLQDLSLQQRSTPEFSAALSDLLGGIQLAGSQILCLSVRPESHVNPEIHSTRPIQGRAHMDAQQAEFQSTSFQETLFDALEDETQHRDLQVGERPSSAPPNFPIEKVPSARQEEIIGRQSADVSVMLPFEIPVANVEVTVEKRLTRTATLRTEQKLHTQTDGVDDKNLQPTLQQRGQVSSTTSTIVKRLLQIRSLPPRETKKERPAAGNKAISEVESLLGSESLFNDLIVDGDSHPSSRVNLFVHSLGALHPSKDNFDDLNDFIVPKKGRDYSQWLKRRQKARRRLYSKNIFKRLQNKKQLLLLLNGT